MNTQALKFIGFSALTLAFASSTALAGPGKNCDEKKKMTKTNAAVTTTTSTGVLSATERATKAKMKKKAYTFDEALELCQKKGADDLQACIDYKTGKVQPKT